MTALVKALKNTRARARRTVYSPDADGEVIARTARRAVPGLAQVPEADPAARFELLRKQHEKEFGAKTPLPPAAGSVLELRKQKGQELPYLAANIELTTALLAKEPASEAELGDLARARAEAIRGALLGSGEVDAKRVFVLGIKPVAAVDGKVRAELALK
jgi:hypothetical protein